MAQKQISMMQVRYDVQRNLPESLELAQIGFTTDECRVFVGLPSSVEPASLVAGRTKDIAPNTGMENVEILTEFTPAHILNNALYKPTVQFLPANSTIDIVVATSTRAFIEYVSFGVDSTQQVLESGAVQIVTRTDNSTTMISQQNNTNADDGIVKIEFDSPSYNIQSKKLSFTVTNNNAYECVLEFLIRGWDV